jgi:hypothetical protein
MRWNRCLPSRTSGIHSASAITLWWRSSTQPESAALNSPTQSCTTRTPNPRRGLSARPREIKAGVNPHRRPRRGVDRQVRLRGQASSRGGTGDAAVFLDSTEERFSPDHLRDLDGCTVDEGKPGRGVLATCFDTHGRCRCSIWRRHPLQPVDAGACRPEDGSDLHAAAHPVTEADHSPLIQQRCLGKEVASNFCGEYATDLLAVLVAEAYQDKEDE